MVQELRSHHHRCQPFLPYSHLQPTTNSNDITYISLEYVHTVPLKWPLCPGPSHHRALISTKASQLVYLVFSLPPALYSHWVPKWQVENAKTWLCSTNSPSTKKKQWYSITPKLKSKTLKIGLHDVAPTHASSSILMPYFPFGLASLANYFNTAYTFLL